MPFVASLWGVSQRLCNSAQTVWNRHFEVKHSDSSDSVFDDLSNHFSMFSFFSVLRCYFLPMTGRQPAAQPCSLQLCRPQFGRLHWLRSREGNFFLQSCEKTGSTQQHPQHPPAPEPFFGLFCNKTIFMNAFITRHRCIQTLFFNHRSLRRLPYPTGQHV